MGANTQETGAMGPGVQAAVNAGAHATMYSFLSAMFNQRPSEDLVTRLRRMGTQGIGELAQTGELPSEAKRGLEKIAQFVEASKGQAEEEVCQELAVDWTRLFRGVAPGYGPPPPYEAVHLGAVEDQAPQVLRNVVRCYLEQGVSPRQEGADRPDYIGLEFDFLALLAEREQAAWEQGDDRVARECALAARQFFQDHPGRWVAQYCQRAISEARTGFFEGLLRLTRGMIEEKNQSLSPDHVQ